MFHVIPFTRAGIRDVEVLKKARPGAPQSGHKYIKRVPYLSGGRLRYRYYYFDDDARTSGKAHHDPDEEHDHHLLSELPKHYPNLAHVLMQTADITIAELKKMLAIRETKVEVGADFHQKMVRPALDAEAQGGDPKRNALQRTRKAFEMIPDHIKDLINPETRAGFEGSQVQGMVLGLWKGFKKFSLLSVAEDPRQDEFSTSRAYATTSEIVILERPFMSTMGEARFNSPKTLGEKVIFHEVGHHVHQAMEARPKEHPDRKAIEAYKKKLEGELISDYAKYGVDGTYLWYEDFAEHFACALAHPKELAESCPERYVWFQKHVLTDMPEIGDMLDTPDEDLAWWDQKPQTPAAKLLRHLKHRSPAPPFHNYYSDKDQFYSVQKEGRTIYLRIGPIHKDEEAGWDRMPPTTYEETITGPDGKPITVTLPKHERRLGPRFKKTESVKEIYDENGRPLTDRQAYYYLGQDDEKAIAGAGDTSDRDLMDAYIKADDKKGPNSTRTLTYKMYTTLGFQLEHEKELARLKKVVAAQKKWDALKKKPTLGSPVGKLKPRPDFHLERHEWAPHEIDADTFRQKTGTFKFGGIRPAPVQTQTMRDPKSGATQTRYDEATGKQVPVLSARLYEIENPDGTYTRINVNESAPFNVGDTIWLPKGGGWERRKLKKGDPLDPFQLARNHDITATELLQVNQKYARGQIADPILAALINPHDKPILDATTLEQLMRSAALDRKPDPITGRMVGRRAWVCLRGSPHADSAIGHVQVEFDGGGAPRVVGDYWARKLGKDEIRIDELLNRQDEIDVPRIKERKPKQLRAAPGELVWFMDPKSERRILGTVVEKKGTTFRVQPRAQQGVGISKDVVSVKRVERTDMSLVPDRPKEKYRFVDPLKKDLLFYMDEVPVDSGMDSSEGVIKVLPPSNGMFGYDELKNMPGIRLIEDRGKLIATISPQDLPRFRERFGGFVMDSRVKAKLKEMDDRTRAIVEEHGKKQLVEAEDLEGEDGNINPNGPLGQLILGDEGIQPGDHRIRALQKLVKNGGRLYAAHYMGTGKTALAIMASELMRELTDPETGKPHSRRTTKRTMFIGPPNTVENSYQEHVKFARPPTLLGTGSLAGAQQVPTLPKQQAKESDSAYKKRALKFWKDGLKAHPSWWNPWADTSDTVICGLEYFRGNEKALSLLDQFDGMVVDEAHKVARENEVSRAIERWNKDLKFLLMMSGTPIKNRLDALPRIISLVTNGEVNLGSAEEFRDRYLEGSAVMKAEGARNPPKTDLNPQRVGELMGYIQPHIDVATTADVLASGKKTMPAVLLDENGPAHMTGQQARMYRAAMAMLTEEERNALAVSAAIGTDEQTLLNPESRKKVQIARSIANCLAYKKRDQRKELTYRTVEYQPDRHGELQEKEVEKVFELPSLKRMTGKRPKGWGGKWPKAADIEKGIVDEGYLRALQIYMDRILGVTYESLEGKKISATIINAIKKGQMTTVTGEVWSKSGSKLDNPDYGPEGMICRGKLDESSGNINPIETTYFDSLTGTSKTVTIKPGQQFVRDFRTPAAGLYFVEDDWDNAGRFDDPSRGKKDPDDPDGDDPDGDEETTLKKRKGQQGPKEGREAYNIQRSPHRRRERAMFDASVTQGNAKCDKLEQNLREQWAHDTGDGPGTQHIIFGNRIGSSVRTVESKLRTMGFMDVNEALGPPSISTEHDKKRALGTRKFYVTYMGVGATLGKRDINSEIYRRQQDNFGGDTGISMFVWRTLYGTTQNKYLPSGEMREPWGKKQRTNIASSFVDATGKVRRDGRPAGLEVPMRVVGHKAKDGTVGQRYIYESEVPPKVKKDVRRLEIEARSQRGAKEDATMAQISKLLMPYAVDRKPLTDTQMDIFNNCQAVVASDAANVGLNWPGTSLTMYDSLFSPMEEEQRITRAARMLPASIKGPAKPLILKIGAYIDKIEAQSKFKEYEGVDSAMLIVREAMENALSPADRLALSELPGGAPDQIVEAWFAQRAFRKIASARDEVGNRLRTEGAVPDKSRPPGEGNFIAPQAIQDSDVMNEIIRERLTPFDREIMKSRRYLVHVKRLTVSADVPEFEAVKVKMGGKTRTIQIPTGQYVTESPVKAERSQMTQGRAKKVPYEYALKKLQSEVATHTKYGYIDAYRGSLGAFARFPDDYTPPQKTSTLTTPKKGEPPSTAPPKKAKPASGKAVGESAEKSIRFHILLGR